MTTFGARIICVVCGAMPWPDHPGIPKRFDLRRFDHRGRPSESPARGLCGAAPITLTRLRSRLRRPSRRHD